MKKVLLVILDGWGLSPLPDGNATYLAKTPNLDWIYGAYPKTSISASGIDVGITPGESGNSEVGHLNLGSGRVVWENLPRINLAAGNGSLFKNENLNKIADHTKSGGSALHLIGLCSAGSVHSNLEHLFVLLKFAKSEGIEKIYIHMITDGRDTAPQVAKEDASRIKKEIAKTGVGKIATIIGRFYAMDRDRHFERTSKAYNLWTLGQGSGYGSAEEAIEANYRAGVDDEKIGSCLIDKEGLIRPGDGIIFFNFRADRMRQMLETFESDNFAEFSRQKISNLLIATMTKYFDRQVATVVFPPLNMNNVVADILETSGRSQSHIAETEKYAHVTYFFNGGEEKLHNREEQILVPSQRVESFDLVPEMSAAAIKDKVVEEIRNQSDFVLLNFANGDMVGHSGNLSAAIRAVEAVDINLGQVMSAASAKGYCAIITADHGNCEIMINPANGEINKEHTSSPVPFVLADLAEKPFTPQTGTNFNHEILLEYSSNPPTGILADVAPTILQLMGLPKPGEMSGIDISNLI